MAGLPSATSRRLVFMMPDDVIVTERLVVRYRGKTALDGLDLRVPRGAVFAFLVVAGAPAFILPQISAVAAGYPIFIAMWLRKQSLAVTAVEERDGVRYYVERTSPFKPTRLVRTPWLRRTEPSPRDTIHDHAVRRG